MIRHKIILSSFIFALLSPAPAALAQNECGPGPTVECEDANYPTGITYNSSVDLSVSATNSGQTTIDANGINLTGTGSASVTWDSTVGAAAGSFGFNVANLFGGDMTNGPTLDVLTDSGDIDITTLGVNGTDGDADTITHGIRAHSTGGGNISIDNDGIISATNDTSGVAAIEAVSTGGNGDVDIFYGGNDSARQAVSGTQYGIIAEAAGSGDLTIHSATHGGDQFKQIQVSHGSGIAAIHATTGTGLLTIETQANGRSGTGVIIDAGGDVVFTGAAFGEYGVDVLNVAAGTTTTLNFISSRSGSLSADTQARAQGDGTVVVNMTTPAFNTLNPTHEFPSLDFDFTGMADRVQVNVLDEAVWLATEGGFQHPPFPRIVPAGNFDIYIRGNGGMSMGHHPGLGFASFTEPHVVSFADADQLLVNEGFFAVGPRRQQVEVRLEGLDEFRHSGKIFMGNWQFGPDIVGEQTQRIGGQNNGVYTNRTDGSIDDVLAVPGVNWVSEGGEIWMDVSLAGGQSQDSCERNADTGNLPAADCVELHGATTSGVTNLVLADTLAFDRGRLVPGQRIVLVDVEGGESAQGHFVVGPNVPGYSPLFGGSWDRGLFQYTVAYDQDDQTHALVGMLNDTAHQQAQLAATAHDLWRTSTATSLDRQADLRDRGEDENGGLWLRFANETADRDVVNVERAGGRDWAFDNGMSRDSYAVTFGLDMLSGSVGGGVWSVGAMGGYVNSDVEYDVSPNRAEINGWSLGAYAGYVAGPLWVDGAINLNEATMRQHIPGFNLHPPDTKVSNDLRSVGLQVDAGVRIDLTPAVFVEPLATLSYVRTDFDDLTVEPDDSSRDGLTVYWNDPTSFRAGLGGRLGMNRNLGGMRTQFSLTAKVWNESDGESVASIHNDAFPDDPDFDLKDEFDDTVTEIGLGASVRSPDNAVSGFINLGGATASDYDTFTAKLGVRYQW